VGGGTEVESKLRESVGVRGGGEADGRRWHGPTVATLWAIGN
jgi:hypothetical protein